MGNCHAGSPYHVARSADVGSWSSPLFGYTRCGHTTGHGRPDCGPLPPRSDAIPADATALLADLRSDDPNAVEALFPLVYDELRQLARRQRRRLPGHTLDTTALVHEAYLKLVRAEDVGWEDRAHFYALSARAMRQILLNHARARNAQRRGGDLQRVALDGPLPDAGALADERAATLLDLDAALDALSHLDERMGRVVELRFYGGLSEEDIGLVLGVSARTVRRDWRQAKAWLTRYLGERSAPPS